MGGCASSGRASARAAGSSAVSSPTWRRAEIAIREAVEQAERIAGTNIDQVFVGFSAGGLVSNVASVEVAIGGRRISPDDIDALLGAGGIRSTPRGG
jgi:cell division protein FtsA